MKDLEKLPMERQTYYFRLHERLVDLCVKAVDRGDWQAVYDTAKTHLELQRLLAYEAAPWPCGGRSKALDIALSIVENYCRFGGCG